MFINTVKNVKNLTLIYLSSIIIPLVVFRILILQ